MFYMYTYTDKSYLEEACDNNRYQSDDTNPIVLVVDLNKWQFL